MRDADLRSLSVAELEGLIPERPEDVRREGMARVHENTLTQAKAIRVVERAKVKAAKLVENAEAEAARLRRSGSLTETDGWRLVEAVSTYLSAHYGKENGR